MNILMDNMEHDDGEKLDLLEDSLLIDDLNAEDQEAIK